MIKILCCEHFLANLEQANINFVKTQHLFCGCDDQSGKFVIQCTYHKMFFKRFDEWPSDCECEATETCTPCLSKMFILNHIVYKVCIRIPPFRIWEK